MSGFFYPLIPAKAGIQGLVQSHDVRFLGPRLRGDERNQAYRSIIRPSMPVRTVPMVLR